MVDYDSIGRAGLNNIQAFLLRWFPAGRQVGKEFEIGNRFGEPGKSLKINTETGRWADFATGDKGGDLISLLAYREGVSQGVAAVKLAEELGLARKSNGNGANSNSDGARRYSKEGGKSAEYVHVSPVPDRGVPDHHAAAKWIYSEFCCENVNAFFFCYRDSAGGLLFYVYRFDLPSGKEIRPLSLWRNGSGKLFWRGKWPPAPLPLFGLEGLARHPDLPVLLVEGEKKAEAAAELLLGRYVVLSLCSGAGATNKIDLQPLADRGLILFPDNDRDGFKAMLFVARKIEALQVEREGAIKRSVKIVKPDPTWSSGHDVGNLIEEGWTAADIINYLGKNTLGVDQFETFARKYAGERFPPSSKPEAPSDPELVRLAALPMLDYDRQRKDAAKRMGVRPVTLDAEVAKVRSASAQSSGAAKPQGQALDLATPEPWPDGVDGAELLAELVATIKRYVILPDGADVAIALWVVFTYAIDCFEVAPRLAILSPVMRSGKTTLLRALDRMALRPLLASNVSPAAIFRTIEAARPTLLIDEADSFARENEELRGLLNSGHTRDAAFVIRVEGDQHEPRKFSTWGAIAVAAIGTLPATWIDRSVVVRLKRKLASERVERLTLNDRVKLDTLARKCARWVADNFPALKNAHPAYTVGLNDRASDNWRPLFAIADAVGGNWSKRARAAALALSGETEASDSLNVVLLRDIRMLFDREPGRDRWSSTELAARLAEIETSPWATLTRGKAITPARLARSLRWFEIHVRQDNSGSYYRQSEFADAFSRYLPDPPSQSAIVPQTVGGVAGNEFSKCHAENGRGTLKSATNPTESKRSGTLALPTPPMSDVEEF